jgi:hypothetical protein
MRIVFEAEVYAVTEFPDLDPPQQFLGLKYKVPPIPLISVDYASGHISRTPIGICDHENTEICLPACGMKIGDRIRIIKL